MESSDRTSAVDDDDDLHLSRLLREEESEDESDVIVPLAVTWDTRTGTGTDTDTKTDTREDTEVDPGVRQHIQNDQEIRGNIQEAPDITLNIDSDDRQNIKMEPDIIQKDPTTSQYIQIDPEMSQNILIHPEISQNILIEPENSQNILMDPEISPNIQIDPNIRPDMKIDSETNANIEGNSDNELSSDISDKKPALFAPEEMSDEFHMLKNGTVLDNRLEFASNELSGSGNVHLSPEKYQIAHRNIEESDNEDNKSVLDNRLESGGNELNNLDFFLANDTRENRLDSEGVLDHRLVGQQHEECGDTSGGVEEDASVGRLLHLVRELANALPTSSYTTGGQTNHGFDATDDQEMSDESSGEEIDWSWLADEAQLCAAEPRVAPRPSSWLRASMRRVRHFALPVSRVSSAPPTVAPTRVSSAPPRARSPTVAPPRVSSAPPRARSPAVAPSRVSSAPPRARSPTVAPPRVSSAPPRARSPTVAPPRVSSAPPLARSLRLSTAVARVSASPSVMPTTPSERLPPLESPLHVPVVMDEDVAVPPVSPDFPRRYSHLGRQAEDSPVQSQQQSDASADEEESECAEAEGKDRWPHSLSSLLAALGCTLGLFNVARFALLSVHFGGNFVVAFLLLSALLGWPLYALHATLGTHLRAGVVDMWHISPVFQGVGIALLMSQAAIGLYSVVGVAWMFTYFRDSFVNRQDSYRWAENGTQLEFSISSYFKSVVLQQEGSAGVGHLKFQVSFNLAVVWMIVFVCLSKGIKSYGTAVHLLGVLPILGLLTLTGKMLTLTPVWFDTTAWSEFLVNTNCWAAAAVECFSTWGLLGAATMQLRTHAGSCRLAREVASVGLVTVATLLSAALLANCFAQLLRDADFTYVPSTFEHSAVFLQRSDAPHLSSTPVSWMPHSHMIVGQQVTVPGVLTDNVSGYQVVRLATELGPAVFAVLGPEKVSPFWTVLFFFTLICFGIGQQLCIWHCVITGVIAINKDRMQAWETTITFLSCTSAFVLGLPFTTERGAVMLFYLDYCIGGAWWLLLLIATMLVAALMACGGEQVARSLLSGRRTLLQAALVFTWNLALPVALTVGSVTWFKSNNYRDLYTGRLYGGYWPAWARRLGCLVQLAPLLTVPLVAAIQTWRHLTNGPQDLFDRLRLLCRPGSSSNSASVPSTVGLTTPSTALPALTPLDDPPPKYTPPPSYATATGARIAKLLRRSFRRLVGPSSAPEPPAYSAALVELGGVAEGRPASTLSANQVARLLRSSMRRTLRGSAPGCLPDSAKPDSVILS